MDLTSNHIYIIGAGAIGKALAVFLQLSGRKVTILRGSIPEAETRTELFNVQMPDGSWHEAEVTVSTWQAFPRLSGTLVLTNKSFGNEQLAVALKDKTGHSPIVLLQNGLGVEKPFLKHGFPEMYRCVLFVTSQVGEGSAIAFKPVAPSPIGIERGSHDGLQRIVRLLDTPHFAFKSEADIAGTVWKKAIINCVFNTICPLLDADNGLFHRSSAALAIARRVISECVMLANARGIGLAAGDVVQKLLEISRSSDGQIISTLQDIRAGRRTELDTLNFEMVRQAEALGLSELTRETGLLGELTRLKEDISLKTHPENHLPTDILP
ncbi:ketopantoate reductase family protein [Dyadobacter fermentans]|uniref:2-dehydropantoate 2-reductase n=1 Tax=Dyadobacter fermentans (strain ATCC 700827 / DSM 18053 / CIP 107007 / KCTC 52180 / NS114) TaxID=471854 RepID=C6W1F5_DYAFD|nr:ketopantoate reductase C-terminal domain-containing protein [Dyadobacter fermentans]ACT92012.1 Ketopantoate reductase ApbA/PanE domain protein [Dyadobacter fermentans DSM 18053]